MATFKDHFSRHADTYAKYRPRYSEEMFRYLASVAPSNDAAWDCGTGNGQAAVGLAQYFDRVFATDASEEQVHNAFPHEKVTYRVAPAEDSGLGVASVDLITVAQALHWFDTVRFFEEARRVLKPGGVVAVWAYTLCKVTPQVDTIVEDFYYNIVGPYWPPERRLVEEKYLTVAFPFDEFKAPPFTINLDWTLSDMMAYLQTWSPVRRYLEAHGTDPTELIAERLADGWGEPHDRKHVVFPIEMRIGRS